jgi:drug/metabolite transporter (DMT)-like permease
LQKPLPSELPAVILEALFFGREYDFRIWVSLLPIVAGVALTTVTELSFVLAGFVCALTACLANALQIIMTELLLKGKLELDSINTVSGRLLATDLFLILWRGTELNFGLAGFVCAVTACLA